MIPVNSVFSVSLKFPISVECITIFIFASKHFSPKPVVPIKIFKNGKRSYSEESKKERSDNFLLVTLNFN